MNKTFDKFISTIFYSISAGILIGLSGYIYLHCKNEYVGAFLFSIGLTAVCIYHLNLYTGMIGYFISKENKILYLLQLIFVIFGNFAGCQLMACLPLSESSTSMLNEMIQYKTSLMPFEILSKSFLCGIIIHIAVDIYKSKKSLLGVLLCVPAFILSKMEHSIANMYYFCAANSIDINFIFICIVGNAIGAWFINIFIPTQKQNLQTRKE